MNRLPVLLAAAVLALGLAACGDEGDTNSTTTASGAGLEADAATEAQNAEVMREYEERQAAEAPTEEAREAEKTASSFYAILDGDRAKGNPNKTTIDSASFCDLMSEEARAQTVHYAKVSSGIARKWDCESAVDLLVVRSKRVGGFKETRGAKVIAVNAEGDRATASVRFGKGPVTSIPLVKEGGEWKLAASPAG